MGKSTAELGLLLCPVGMRVAMVRAQRRTMHRICCAMIRRTSHHHALGHRELHARLVECPLPV